MLYSIVNGHAFGERLNTKCAPLILDGYDFRPVAKGRGSDDPPLTPPALKGNFLPTVRALTS